MHEWQLLALVVLSMTDVEHELHLIALSPNHVDGAILADILDPNDADSSAAEICKAGDGRIRSGASGPYLA